MIISGSGITVDLPSGWEGSIRPPATMADGARRYSVTHLANFPLPAIRGDYGSGAVDVMSNGDALIILLEFGPENLGTALFSAERPPLLRPSDFNRDMLQQRMEGQGGTQRFFTEAGRAFCLYIVVGDHIDRADALEPINVVLSRTTIA